ncbi:MAG TPA: ABC transporter substrate-binding protein [Xanthobacteraceae bacterium]|nr:ABC transporter substrate-binding protein [Xanthobacteraceae bacterium]
MRRAIMVAAALLAAAPDATAAAESVTLRYGQIPSTVRSVSSLYAFIAQQKGFLARESIKLEHVPIPGGTDKMVAALGEGRVDVTQTASPYLIQAVLAGSDAVAIAGETANPIYSLIAKSEIASFSDLKGRLVGLSLPVDTISISMRKLLALKGLQEHDYRVKELVGSPVRFECLKRGECDAVPLGQPDDLVAIQQGYRRLGVSTEAVAAFQFQVIAARRAWAQSNKDTLVRFIRAMASAFGFIRDGANRGEVIKAMVELTGASDDIARQTLALYFEPDRGVLPKQAEIDLKGLAQVIAFMAEGGVLEPPLPAPERFVDLQYLRAAGVH